MILSADHPVSPTDLYYFDEYNTTLESLKSTLLNSPIKTEKTEETCVVYDCEIEPFEYKIEPFFPIEPSRDSLNSVFEDSDLIESIMTSLKTEQQAGPIQVVSPQNRGDFPCLRKSGTFLNKDGRWIKGKPCQVSQCDKRAQSNGLCKGHGGGARCKVDGCQKSSQGSGLCRAHGGGKRCLYENCDKGTQRKGYCYLHGGVRSCVVEGCERKDRGNGKCFAHGCGRRCQAPYCLTTIRTGTLCEIHTK